MSCIFNPELHLASNVYPRVKIPEIFRLGDNRHSVSHQSLLLSRDLKSENSQVPIPILNLSHHQSIHPGTCGLKP